MQRLKRIVIVSTAFVSLLLAIGLLLPDTWHAERSVVIRAPAATIFPSINNLKQWREWSVGHQQHAQRQTEYSGPEAGVGATSRWSDEAGRGVMKIMQSEQNRLVAYTWLLNGGELRAEGTLTLVPEGEVTRVVWSAAGNADRKSAFGYFALFQGFRIGAGFADSLEMLKQKLETRS